MRMAVVCCKEMARTILVASSLEGQGQRATDAATAARGRVARQQMQRKRRGPTRGLVQRVQQKYSEKKRSERTTAKEQREEVA